MKEEENGISEDIQLFIDKFEPAKYKLMEYGIEVRGIKDIHRSLAEAAAIIERLGLKVSISHDAGMLSYGAFEVRNN
ncbi:hypothetical protein [Pedobacter soli]|uniref:Uncharacterized protein n=1 Tax=Pedobacter soli TaxID=390242 RepID=A0A1G7AVZ5_9SPHI|nr:hypothetical protein [Pedobacter soli]SDE19044.1 hypothetical protein SAMN04488024_11376 [Pedobacter soli]